MKIGEIEAIHAKFDILKRASCNASYLVQDFEIKEQIFKDFLVKYGPIKKALRQEHSELSLWAKESFEGELLQKILEAFEEIDRLTKKEPARKSKK